jgi:hypothetical protein
VFISGKLFWAVVQPGNLLLLALLAGFLLLIGSRGRRGGMLIGLAAIGFLVFAVAPVGPAMLLVLEQRFPRPQTGTTAGKEWAGLAGYRLRGWTEEFFPSAGTR